MSKQYPGGIISKTAPVPSGPYADSTAPGIWTLDQQAAYAKQGNWPTAGNVNPSVFIETLFSTYVYSGNSSTQTITNGIDLSTNGGMVWGKMRNNSGNNWVMDTVRGINSSLVTQTNDGAINPAGAYISSFNTNGFSLGSNITVNGSTYTYTSWTFRKQPKFFDVVTYTGTGTTNSVAHSLASVPGAIFIKRTSSAANWRCLCKNGTNYSPLQLNTTSGDGGSPIAITLCATSTELDIGYIGAATGDVSSVNTNGETYVAYIFAHNAGGFGLSGSENVITCGSSSVNSSGNDIVDLGFEPQWVLIKPVGSSGGNWQIRDVMRNFSCNQFLGASLFPNLSSAEVASSNFWMENSTGGSNGFRLSSIGFTSQNYIYIAIRRGPMAVPTTGTSVFQPTVWTGTGAALQQNVNINYDAFLQFRRNGGYTTPWMDKLRGFGYTIYTQSTDAESNQTAYIAGPTQNNYINFVNNIYNLSGEPWLNYAFVRAPGFFDAVCYTGNGSTQNVSHNLGVAPELMFVKSRSLSGSDWWVYASPLTTPQNKYLRLQSTDAESTATGLWGSSLPTSTTFGLGAFAPNSNGATFVAYLFATLAGVSKVGSYTGTGAAQTINCGFTAGSRFVLIKRTDTTGDWYSWDSARGIVAGNDPYLLWNTTAAEVTNTDYVDTAATGFEISSTAPAAINANGGTYIFLAIA